MGLDSLFVYIYNIDIDLFTVGKGNIVYIRHVSCVYPNEKERTVKLRFCLKLYFYSVNKNRSPCTSSASDNEFNIYYIQPGNL